MREERQRDREDDDRRRDREREDQFVERERAWERREDDKDRQRERDAARDAARERDDLRAREREVERDETMPERALPRDGREERAHHVLRLRLGKVAVLDDPVEEAAAGAQRLDQVYVALALEDAVELDHVGVAVQEGEHVHFLLHGLPPRIANRTRAGAESSLARAPKEAGPC